MEPIDFTSETIAYARELRALYRSAEQRAVRFRLLVEMGRDLVNARGIDALLRLALVRATTFSGYDAGCVLLLSADGALEKRATIGVDALAACSWERESEADIRRALHADGPLVPACGNDRRHRARVYLPLIPSDGRALGVLLLASGADVRPPDADDLDALQLLASQLAAALQSVQLHEEKGLLVEQLIERERRLEDLLECLLRAQEEEHRRIAYELHDGLAQMMLGILQQLHTLADRYRPRSPRSRAALSRAVEMAQAGVTEARRVIAGLRPTVLDDFGLATALRMQVAALQAEGWSLSYEETLGEARLPPALEIALFRIAQEALSNVRKHAGTTHARLTLWKAEGSVHLSVQDWGCGFAPALLAGPAEPGSRIGLLGMQERVSLLSGQWQIQSQPGSGTRVCVTLPLPPATMEEPDRE